MDGHAGRVTRGFTALDREALSTRKESTKSPPRGAPAWRQSAGNCLHYLSVRRHNIRALQREPSRPGLPSLGRLEAHALASVVAVLGVAGQLNPQPRRQCASVPTRVDFGSGNALLARRTKAILAPRASARNTRIMVTLPSEGARDRSRIPNLLAGGLGMVRISRAHGGETVRGQVIHHPQCAAKRHGRQCKGGLDLAGPRLRRGAIAAVMAVAKWRPKRDPHGLVIASPALTLVPGGMARS